MTTKNNVTLKKLGSYLHGSNEVNYTRFVCSTCGQDDTFGKIICLPCHARIVNADALLEACKNLLDALDKCGEVGRNSRFPKTVQHAVTTIANAEVKS